MFFLLFTFWKDTTKLFDYALENLSTLLRNPIKEQKHFWSDLIMFDPKKGTSDQLESIWLPEFLNQGMMLRNF